MSECQQLLDHWLQKDITMSSKKRGRDSSKKQKKSTPDSNAWKSRPHNPSSFPGAVPINNQPVDILKKHVHPHLQSFNFFLDEGITAMITDLPEYQIDLAKDNKLSIWIDSVTISPAMKRSNDTDNRLFPAECRERQIYYSSDLTLRIGYSINDAMDPKIMTRVYSGLPIMTGSNICHLNGMSPEQLITNKEEAHEFGGTFICNGIERVIRMLQVPRRNHPMAIERNAFSKKGPLFTTKGCTIRCGRPDLTSITLTLHYLNDGSVTVRFMMEKAEYFIPLVMLLKALCEVTDREIYEYAVGASTPSTSDSKSDTKDNAGSADATTSNNNNNDESSGIDKQFIADRVELMLHDNKKLELHTKEDHLSYIGSRFRIKLRGMYTDRTDAEYGQELIDRFVLVHIHEEEGDDVNQVSKDKFNLLLLMLRKLYSFASGSCCNDNPDSAMNQELLLPGHLYGMIIKERLDETLKGIDAQISRDLRNIENGRGGRNLTLGTILDGDITYMNKTLSRQVDIGQKMQYFMATGNLLSNSGMDLMQQTGFTVVAEKLNWLRYLAHFRCVHRGAFFSTMKTTTVRKILPENWGFICPVHSPDGAPCGLLQHITATNLPVTHQEPINTKKVISLLLRLGCYNINSTVLNYNHFLPILLDGKLIGWMKEKDGPKIVDVLRKTKIMGTPDKIDSDSDSDDDNHEMENNNDNDDDSNKPKPLSSHHALRILPMSTEIAYFPTMKSSSAETNGPFPGLFLATSPARMLRPVTNLALEQTEYIGPMEQVFLNIACTPDDVKSFENATQGGPKDLNANNYDVLISSSVTHMETDPMNLLSLIASLTPFSDFNQSPRNMYQCQMGKQTMGTPAMALVHRTDNKLYRIQTPQAPIVQNRNQSVYKMDEYPNGTNAIVAVITYTGYDLEDAMIINKSSMERGFAHATVYKTKTIDLKQNKGGTPNDIFHNMKKKYDDEDIDAISGKARFKWERVEATLDKDGLPYVGLHLSLDTPMYVTQDEITNTHKVHNYKDTEPAIVDEVRYVDNGKITIRLRYNRNPMVGDKFATRSGQKGVCSVLWPARDMPFTESGMVPDILFNPHGFPSRMTIGMQIEAMAGKAGACKFFYV